MFSLANCSTVAAGCLIIASSALVYLFYANIVESTSELKTEVCDLVAPTAVSTTTVGTQTHQASPEAQCMEIAQAASGNEAIDIASKVVNSISYESVYYLVIDHVESYTNRLVDAYGLATSDHLVRLCQDHGGIEVFQTDLLNIMATSTYPILLPLIFGRILTGTMSPEGTLEAFQTATHAQMVYGFNVSIAEALRHMHIEHHLILDFLKTLDNDQDQYQEIANMLGALT